VILWLLESITTNKVILQRYFSCSEFSMTIISSYVIYTMDISGPGIPPAAHAIHGSYGLKAIVYRRI
jgi:hypothetical protein